MCKRCILSHLHFVSFIFKLSLAKPIISPLIILGILRPMKLLSISSKRIIHSAAFVFGGLEGEIVEGRYGLGMHLKIERELVRLEMGVIYC